MNGKILIVGGYGNVGRTISSALGDFFPGQVVAAGRNYQKAKALSSATQQKVLPLELDIETAHQNDDLLNGIKLVVMCLDQTDTRFVEKCIGRGIHYVDISASYDFLSKIERLAAKAQQHGATAVLSVGLTPGLTNLLAAHCHSALDETQQVDIYVMLGLGEAHGEAAIRWTIENLRAEFPIQENGITRWVKSFAAGKQTLFPAGIGKRRAYRFNFSDQQVIPKTLGIETASAWLCFDSALMTYLFAFLTKVGLVNLLRFRSVQEVLVRLFKTVRFGSDRFVAKVEAKGKVKGQETLYQSSISGREEGRATALVTIEVARQLYTASLPPGVFHIEQLFEPLAFIEALNDGSLHFIPGDNPDL